MLLWEVDSTMILDPAALSTDMIDRYYLVVMQIYILHGKLCKGQRVEKRYLYLCHVHAIECRYVMPYTEQFFMNIAGFSQAAFNSNMRPFTFYPCLSALGFKQAIASSLHYGNSSA